MGKGWKGKQIEQAAPNEHPGSKDSFARWVSGLSLFVAVVSSIVLGYLQYREVNDLRVSVLATGDRAPRFPNERSFVLTNNGNRPAIVTEAHTGTWGGQGWRYQFDWEDRASELGTVFPLSIPPQETRIIRLRLPRPSSQSIQGETFFGLVLRSIDSNGLQFTQWLSFGFGRGPNASEGWDDVRELDLMLQPVFLHLDGKPELDLTKYVDFNIQPHK